MRLETILDLGRQYGIELPGATVEEIRPHATITSPHPGLVEFLDKFHWSMAVLADADACERLAFENIEDAARERLDYVELRFSPVFMARAHDLDAAAVTEAVIAGVRRGVERFGVHAGLIGIMSRTYGVETCRRELEILLAQKEHLVAMDLAGDEAAWPARLFQEHFRIARDAGLRITVHAGEAAGPESIREAIELLGAERIGHGIAAAKDPELMDLLREKRIGLECCLTSNVQTSTVASFEDHPLKRFLQEGILATINTDDPGISGIDLDHEYETAAPAAGLTVEEIATARRNAAAIAFLPVAKTACS